MHARFRAISSCTCLLQLALESCHSCESAGQQFPYSPSPVPDLVLAWICYDAVLLERIWGRPTTYLPYLLFFQPLRLSTDLLYLHLLFTHPLLHSSSSSLFPFTYVTLNHALLIIHSLGGGGRGAPARRRAGAGAGGGGRGGALRWGECCESLAH